MAKITKSMSIGEIVQKYPETFPVFAKHRLHCIGCAISAYETLEQGAEAHGINIDKLVKDLNSAVEPAKKAVKKKKGKK